MEEVLAGLPADHPLVAVFMPFMEADPAVIRDRAAGHFEHIRNAPLPERAREALEVVFLAWLLKRLQMSRKEFDVMINMIPLEETPIYKEIAEEVTRHCEARFAVERAAERAESEALIQDLFPGVRRAGGPALVIVPSVRAG